MRSFLCAALLLVATARCGSRAEPPAEKRGPVVLSAARAALEQGRLEEADRLLAAVLQADPDQAEALVARAGLLLGAGRTREAADLYLRLADLRPENGLYALRAGSCLEVVGRLRDAEPYLARAARQRPDDPDASYRYGLHLFNLGDYPSAEPLLRRATALDPARTDAWLKLGQAIDRMARFGEALQVLDQAVAAQPGIPLLRFQRALVRSRAGDASGATADLKQVVLDDPDLYGARYALARALMASGEQAKGEAEMGRFAAEEEARRARDTTDMAAQAMGSGHADDPVLRRRRLEELVLQRPENTEAWRWLGSAYALEGDFQQAEAAYARAARLDPADAVARRERGRALLDLGRTVEALSELQEAARIAPEDHRTAALLRRARERGESAAAPGGRP